MVLCISIVHSRVCKDVVENVIGNRLPGERKNEFDD